MKKPRNRTLPLAPLALGLALALCFGKAEPLSAAVAERPGSDDRAERAGSDDRAERAGPEDVAGTWQGVLALPNGMSLTVVMHLSVSEDGGLTASMDSPDQGARGIPVQRATFEEGRLILEVTAVAGRYEGELTPEGTLTGRWTQGGLDVPLDLERVDEVAGPPRPQHPEPPFPYAAEDVFYDNPESGIRLAGTLTVPREEGPFPAVALITGSGAQERDSEVFGHKLFLVLADHLTRRGIVVLRSDDRGVGESEGTFAEATSRDFARDAASAVAYLRTRPEVDPTRVGLVGMSEGGIIAPMVATGMERVDFVVLLAAPGLTGEEILYLQAERISRAMGAAEPVIEATRERQARLFAIIKAEEEPEARARELESALRGMIADLDPMERAALGISAEGEGADQWIESQLRALRGPWFRYFLLHDPRPVLRQLTVPVLAVTGELDLQVPPAENLPEIEAALARAGNEEVTVVELPGLNHLLQTASTGVPAEYARIEETMSPAALDLVADWILER